MNKKNVEDIIINKIYIEFQKEYNINLPALQQIKRVSDTESFASINCKKAYEKKYILNIDTHLMQGTDVQIYTILYHEFTHIMDSLLFLNYDYSIFANIMGSYSEVHASEIEMKKRFFYSDNIVNEHSYIAVNDILVTIEEYMQKCFEKIVNDFEKMSKMKIKDMFFNPISLYYYIGKMKALKERGINLEFDYYKICPEFMVQCKNAYDTLLEENINIDKVVKDYSAIEESYRKCVLINQIPL